LPHSASFSHFYTPTLGLSLEKKLMRVDNSEVTVCIWDTAGQ
jgi:GTPase SAR1 family protein